MTTTTTTERDAILDEINALVADMHPATVEASVTRAMALMGKHEAWSDELNDRYMRATLELGRI